MRRGFGVIGVIVTVLLLAIVAVIGYNIGWSQGVGTHLPEGATNMPAPYYYGYGFHPFFAGFGILWFLLILFGLFWLLRLAFFGRRWGGWGYGRGMGMGYGPHSFEERAQEWHRRQHGEQPPSGSSTSPPPPPDTRSV